MSYYSTSRKDADRLHSSKLYWMPSSGHCHQNDEMRKEMTCVSHVVIVCICDDPLFDDNEKGVIFGFGNRMNLVTIHVLWKRSIANVPKSEKTFFLCDENARQFTAVTQHLLASERKNWI